MSASFSIFVKFSLGTHTLVYIIILFRVFSRNFQCFSMLSCDNNQGDEQRLCKFVVLGHLWTQ